MIAETGQAIKDSDKTKFRIKIFTNCFVIASYSKHIQNITRETKHIVRRAPAVKIVTKICSFVTFVTIVQGTFLTFSVVRY